MNKYRWMVDGAKLKWMCVLRRLVFCAALVLPLLAGSTRVDAQTLRKLPYVGGAGQVVSEDPAYLIREYEEWRDHYVVKGWHPIFGPSGKRVMRDASSDFDTVSEGQAYGMLLAVYFDDQETFDDLYLYANRHFNPANGLMHWLQNKRGENICEFGLPIDSTARAYIYRRIDELRNPITSTTYRYNEPDRTATPSSSVYVQAAKYNRDYSAAPDADLDIAAALCFAYKKWGWSRTLHSDYRDLAARMIKGFVDHETLVLDASAGRGAGHRFQKAGNTWGSNFVWNPSYFTPAWFEVFIKFINDNKSVVQPVFDGNADRYVEDLTDLMKTMTAHMALIRSKSGNTLYPDWCDTSDSSPFGKVQKINPAKQNVSDRLYYLDENEDGLIDDRNNDGRISFADAYIMQSFNFYYDAVRVPWRMGMHYAWFGNNTSEYYLAAYNVARFFRPKFYNEGIYDGYSMKGGAWNPDDRDGFHVTADGSCMRKDIVRSAAKNKNSPTFIAMIGAASLAYNDPQYTRDLYDVLKNQCKAPFYDPNTGEPTKYNYYGNTLRLLSMLYMTGYMADYSAKPANLMVGLTPLDTNDYTNNIGMQLQVLNNGKETVNLSDIKLEYWFTDESPTAHAGIAEIDYAIVSTPDYIGVPAEAAVREVSQGGQNRCMTVTFSGSTTTLPPGGRVELQVRIHKDNWGYYYQPDDYSFSRNTQGSWSKSITAYYRWEKVWGYRPGE